MHYYCQTCLQCRGLYAWAPWQPHWHGIPLKLPIVFLDSNLWSHAPGSSGSRKQIPSRMNETKTSVHTTEGIHTKYANRCTDTSSRHTNIMQAQPTLCLFPTWSVNGREWGVVVGSWGKTHVSVFHCCLVPVHKFHQWVPERSRERRERKSGIRITRRRSENQSVHASLQIFHINAPRWSCQQTADSPRFLQSPRLGCSSVHQIEKYQQLWVCMWEDLCMCVPSVNGGVCLCGKEAKATTWCKLNPPPTG